MVTVLLNHVLYSLFLFFILRLICLIFCDARLLLRGSCLFSLHSCYERATDLLLLLWNDFTFFPSRPLTLLVIPWAATELYSY